jgi:hypothetical protein
MASTLLIAASPGGAREILGAFDRHADYCLAQSFEEGLERLKERDFVAIVVGYYFDQGQPFRFISEAQAARPDVPILLVRPLPIAMRDSPEDIRSAYRQLGVADFFPSRPSAPVPRKHSGSCAKQSLALSAASLRITEPK